MKGGGTARKWFPKGVPYYLPYPLEGFPAAHWGLMGSLHPAAGTAVAVEQRGVGKGDAALPPDLPSGCGVLEVSVAGCWQGARHDLCLCPQRGVPGVGKGQVSFPEQHCRLKLLDRNSSGTQLGSCSASSYGDFRMPLTQLWALAILFFRVYSSPTSTRGITLQVWGMWEEGSEHLRSLEKSVDTLGKISPQPLLLSGHTMI